MSMIIEILMKEVIKNMKEKNIIEVAKKLRNQKAKEWRDRNKEKVR